MRPIGAIQFAEDPCERCGVPHLEGEMVVVVGFHPDKTPIVYRTCGLEPLHEDDDDGA